MGMVCVKGIHHQFTAVMFTAKLKIMAYLGDAYLVYLGDGLRIIYSSLI